MRDLLWCIRAEWLRSARGALRWLLPASALGGATYAFALSLLVEGGQIGARSGFYLWAVSCSGMANAAATFGALTGAVGLSNDFASGLARSILSRPVARGAWVGARGLILSAAVTLLFLSSAAGALLVGAARYGLSGVSEGDYTLASGGFVAGQLAWALAVSTAAICALVWLGVWWGVAFRRTGSAVIATVAAGAVLVVFSRWASLASAFPLVYLDRGLDRATLVAQGLATPHADTGAFGAAFVCLLWAFGCWASSTLTLQKRDVLS